MPTEDEQIGKKQVVVNLTLAEYKVSFKIKTYSNYCNALNLPKRKKNRLLLFTNNRQDKRSQRSNVM